ncbi:hypothetical protein [Shewanella colwelliana]|uniref:hypothetical protein n=1 Tax=Shewanella colwelliana TaxID=23 RepID=UPI003735C1F8
MNYLLPGNEPLERMNLIIGFTKMAAGPQIDALVEHYVNGLPAERAAVRFGIELSNFIRAQRRLEEVATNIERVKEIDWARFGYQSQKQAISCQLSDNNIWPAEVERLVDDVSKKLAYSASHRQQLCHFANRLLLEKLSRDQISNRLLGAIDALRSYV